MLLEPVGAGAPLIERQLFPGVLGQDRALVGVEQLARVDVVEVEADGVRIDHLGVGDPFLLVVERRRELGPLGDLPGPPHVLGGDRHAVAPPRVAQVEGEQLVIARPVVRGGELGRDGGRVALEISLLPHQLQEELAHQLVGKIVGREEQLVDPHRLARPADHQDAAAAPRGGIGGGGRRRGGTSAGRGQGEQRRQGEQRGDGVQHGHGVQEGHRLQRRPAYYPES